MELEEILSKIDKKHICYQEKDFLRDSVKNNILKRIFKGMSIVSLFSICAFGINKNSSINSLSSNIFETVNNYYLNLGLSQNYTDITTFATFGLPLYFLVRRKN